MYLQVDNDRVVHVSAVVILQRSDKRPDRCEISPEQLTDAAVFADVSLYLITFCGKAESLRGIVISSCYVFALRAVVPWVSR